MQILVTDKTVGDLLTALRNSSVGLSYTQCDPSAVAQLERLGYARIQRGSEGRPDRVKALAVAFEVEIRTE